MTIYEIEVTDDTATALEVYRITNSSTPQWPSVSAMLAALLAESRPWILALEQTPPPALLAEQAKVKTAINRLNNEKAKTTPKVRTRG